MKPTIVTILILASLCGACCGAQATPLYVLQVAAAEPNRPAWIDPNRVTGELLWISSDPNDPNAAPVWERNCGKLNGTGWASDPDGDSFTVATDSPGWTASVDLEAGQWSLAGDIKAGPNYIHVWVEDAYGARADYTLIVYGLNRPPMLHPIGE